MSVWQKLRKIDNHLQSQKPLELVTDPVRVLLESIRICSNNRQDLSEDVVDEMTQYRIVEYAIHVMFKGDSKAAEGWYRQVPVEDIDRIRMLIALNEDSFTER